MKLYRVWNEDWEDEDDGLKFEVEFEGQAVELYVKQSIIDYCTEESFEEGQVLRVALEGGEVWREWRVWGEFVRNWRCEAMS